MRRRSVRGCAIDLAAAQKAEMSRKNLLQEHRVWSRDARRLPRCPGG